MAADDDRPFRVQSIDFAAGQSDLRGIRDTVFIEELSVPPGLEADGLDPQCLHAIAHAADGTPIGTGRLAPPSLAKVDGFPSAARIGRVAVLPGWRDRGVGGGLLLQLMGMARQQGWREVMLDAQVAALEFYRRHGFTAVGERFMAAGIEHQAMRWSVGSDAIEGRDAAVAITTALVDATRRGLWIYSRELDPGLFDAPEVLQSLRRLGTARHAREVRIVLHDAAAAQRAQAPLLALAQRLPSVFRFREVSDPVDRAYPSAFIANDAGGFYFRKLGHRFDGEADLHAPGRARQLRGGLDRVWERSRPVTEYRALGL